MKKNVYLFLWLIVFAIILVGTIRFLGIPVILEQSIQTADESLASPEIKLLAQAASADNIKNFLRADSSSIHFKIYGVMGIFSILSIPIMFLLKKQHQNIFKSPVFYGVLWIFFVFLSNIKTLSTGLSYPTTIHLLLCFMCFLMGYTILSHTNIRYLLWILSIALIPVLLTAFQQHYGGLEEVRKTVFEIIPPEKLPEDLFRRLTSNRVFGTMIYPNSLAGLLMLLLPPCLCSLWLLPPKIPPMIRLLCVGILGYIGAAALYWTGSKTAWLILIGLGITVLFLKTKLSLKIKTVISISILCIGLTGFGIVFSDYFKRGATSVSARFDYWNAAVLNIKNHPFMGSGPGTFAIPYHFSKRPESEMAKLCHNDYLEQASDSGIPASVAYLAFWGCCLYHIWRRYKTMSPLQLSIILGISTFALQALTEFSLYIPAIAWVAFALLGYSVYQARFPHLLTCSSEKEIRL